MDDFRRLSTFLQIWIQMYTRKTVLLEKANLEVFAAVATRLIAKINGVKHLYIKAITGFGLSNHQTTQPYPPKTGQKPASLSGVFPICDFDRIFSYIIKGLKGK